MKTRKTIKSFDDHVIHFETAGKGPPLILLHGVGMSSGVWKNQVQGLSDMFTVIAVDSRGHGMCSDDTEDFSIESQARDVHMLITHLNQEGVFLFGWSMGAAVAFRYIQDFGHEEKVIALGLVGATTDYRVQESQRAEFQQWMDLLASPDKNWPQFFAMSCLTGTRDPENQALLEKITSDTGSSTIIKSAICLSEESFDDLIPTLKIPILICCGRHDNPKSVQAAERLSQAVSKNRLVFFEESGHSPFLQEPEKFNREVIQEFHTRRQDFSKDQE